MILDVYIYKIFIKLIHDDASYFDWQPLTGLTINCNNDKKLQVNDPFFLRVILLVGFPRVFVVVVVINIESFTQVGTLH